MFKMIRDWFKIEEPKENRDSWVQNQMKEIQAHFEKEVLHAKEERVIVDFYTPHCPSCLQMMPLVASVASTLQDKVKFVKVDGANLPQLMERYAVTSVPSFLIFEGGLVAGRTTATMTKREIREFAQRNLK